MGFYNPGQRFGKDLIEWNANQETLAILAKTIQSILDNSMIDNVHAWFKSVRALKMLMINHKKIKPENKDKIIARIKALEDVINQVPKSYIGLKLSNEASARLAQAEKELDLLSTDLIGLLYDADIILPIPRKRPEFSGLEIN